MLWWLDLARKKMRRWIASFGKSYHGDVLQLAKQLFSVRLPLMTKFFVMRECDNIIAKLANILRDKSVNLNQEYIFIINIFMAILVTTLCERADDHGGCRRHMAALWPHSRRHTTLRNLIKKQVSVVKSRKNH